jgi:hypothetical protein
MEDNIKVIDQKISSVSLQLGAASGKHVHQYPQLFERFYKVVSVLSDAIEAAQKHLYALAISHLNVAIWEIEVSAAGCQAISLTEITDECLVTLRETISLLQLS